MLNHKSRCTPGVFGKARSTSRASVNCDAKARDRDKSNERRGISDPELGAGGREPRLVEGQACELSIPCLRSSYNAEQNGKDHSVLLNEYEHSFEYSRVFLKDTHCNLAKCNHECGITTHILLEKSKSQTLPTLKGEEYQWA